MACISKTWFSSNIHRIKIISLTLFIYLFSPFIIVAIILLHVFRKCVSVCAKFSQSDLDQLVSPSSALLANDDLYGIPNHNIVVWFILKGRVSIDNLQSTVYEKVLNKTNSSGQFIYSQLRQYPVHFFKFIFWKWDEDFKIESHIYVYEKAKDDNKCWNEEDVLDIQKNLLRKQWGRHRSPWEIFLIPNYKPINSSYRETKTVMFVRFHECLGDSFSWFQLFVTNLCDCDNVGGHHFPRYKEDCDISQPPLAVSRDSGIKSYLKSLKKISKSVAFPFKVPFDFAQQILEPPDVNEWNVKEAKLIKRDHLKIVDKFSTQHIKDIKNMLGVSFTSVLLSATTAAIRTTFINMGIQIPRTIKIAFPLSAHCQCDEQLGNFLSSCYIKLPTGIASTRERVRICEEAYKSLKDSTVPASNIYIRYLLGLLPYKYFKPIVKNQPWTGNILVLPGPYEYLSIAEHPIEDFVVSATSDSGFILSFLSYADCIRMSLVLDHRLIPADHDYLAKELLANIYAEFVLLGIEGMV